MAWSSSETIHLTCSKKWFETPDSVSFELSSDSGNETFHFKAGQFSSLGFNIEGKTVFRAYSISSIPGSNRLKFTVKRVPDGLVSNHIVDALSVGQKVQVQAPIGEFNNVDCAPKQKVLMISAGCGVTPVMSMVDQWLDEGANIDIEFLHLAKSKLDAIYFDRLMELNQTVKSFHLNMLLEDNTGTDFPQGLISLEWLKALVSDFQQRTIYLCGPTGFMEVVKSALEDAQFDMSQFHQESFTPAQVTAEAGEGTVKIAVPDFGVEVEADEGSLLIDALEKGGVPVIAACRSGICGSCKCKVKVGQVESSSYETLSHEERESGYVLACSTTIKSNVEVSLN